MKPGIIGNSGFEYQTKFIITAPFGTFGLTKVRWREENS